MKQYHNFFSFSDGFQDLEKVLFIFRAILTVFNVDAQAVCNIKRNINFYFLLHICVTKLMFVIQTNVKSTDLYFEKIYVKLHFY